jgi:hypothetical protein
MGKPVNWNAHIMTLSWYVKNRPDCLSDTIKQFIKITPSEENGDFALKIGLATVRIDHPAILKTIIMIQNYKRLRIGRHEYGEPVRIEREN